MNDAIAKGFWSKQTGSRHRSDDPQFYRRKAEEHASLMFPEERVANTVDLGCGAGELLFYFSDHANVKVGLDFSQSMLDEAQKKLKGKNIEILNADIFEYLPQSELDVWTTTGAINQYLNAENQNLFLNIFSSHKTATSLFLFDCVDPLMHSLMPYGISYRQSQELASKGVKSLLRPAYRLTRRTLIAAKLALGSFDTPSIELPGAGMGFGFSPRFWLDAAKQRRLGIEIVSSRFYEYRYHVILRKSAT